MQEVKIICDGASSLKNGRRRAACAAIIFDNEADFKILTMPLGEITNNQAEIVACCVALESLKTPSNVKVLSDSQYVVETMNGKFRQTSNLEFWRRLNRASAPHKVKWCWIRRCSDPLQKIADYLARKTAEMQQTPSDALTKAREKILQIINEKN